MKQQHEYMTHILAIGPHPDDVEVGCGGALYQSSRAGKSNAIIDLTPSQLSTHGDVDTRQEEAQCASKRLGVQQRTNMLLPDGHIMDVPEYRILLATQIRIYKPEIVMMPWATDRHPDHEATAQLVKNAVFTAGLQKIDIDGLPVHKPRLLLHYMIRQDFAPDLVLQLDDESFAAKMAAFACYESQQQTNGRGVEYLTARHIVHGHSIGVRYGEAYKLYSHGVGIQSFESIQSGFF